jgi:hypothetical protein
MEGRAKDLIMKTMAVFLLIAPAIARAADVGDLPVASASQPTPAIAGAGYGRTIAGYDGALRQPLFLSAAGATLWGPLAIHGGAMFESDRARLGPMIGVDVLLTRGAGGPIASLSLSYKAEGFSEPEGEIEGAFSLAETIGHAALYSVLLYGQDPEARDRDAEIGGGASISIAPSVRAGIDSLMRLNLGSLATSPRLAARLGPDLVLRIGRVALSAGAGIAMTERAAGAFGLVGVSVLF